MATEIGSIPTAYPIDCGAPLACKIKRLYLTAPLAFTTIPGSAGAPDSFVGTAGVDAIAFTASRTSYFLGAQGDNDVVAWVGTSSSPITVTDATIKGGAGNDLFTATNTVFASVFINGNAGDDIFEFWSGPSSGPTSFLGSTLQGGQGNDTFRMNTVSSSLINGNKGDDEINLGAVSNSSIYGGQGDDTITLFSSVQNTLIDGGLGNDRIDGTDEKTEDIIGFTASGNDGDDTMLGSSAADILNGDLGNDSIVGGAGNDTINGGKGADTLTGGPGDNTFVLATGDSFAATSGAGAAVTFSNGVDSITDFTTGTTESPVDSAVLNGTEIFFAEFGLARIVNGSYNIIISSANGVYGVLGDYSAANNVFTMDSLAVPGEDYSGDILVFASTAVAGSSVAVTSVEAAIVSVNELVG